MNFSSKILPASLMFKCLVQKLKGMSSFVEIRAKAVAQVDLYTMNSLTKKMSSACSGVL